MTDLSKYRRGLAKVAGLTPNENGDRVFNSTLNTWVVWVPDVKVEQAVQVLEALPVNWTWRIHPNEVHLWDIAYAGEAGWRPTHIAFEGKIADRTCRAIIAALGLKEDDN